MTKTANKILLGVLTALFMVCFAFASSSFITSKKVSAYENDFVMLSDASVRLVTDNAGLRFKAEISETAYNSELTYGMLIVPLNYITDNSVTENYILELKTVYGESGILTVNCTPYLTESGAYRINGVITNIKTANYTRDFFGLGYSFDGTTYSYATFTEGQNVHNIYEVASTAVNGDAIYSEGQQTILNTYLESGDLSNKIAVEYNCTTEQSTEYKSENSNYSQLITTSKVDASTVYAGARYLLNGLDISNAILNFDINMVSNCNTKVAIKAVAVTSDFVIYPQNKTQPDGVTSVALGDGWYRMSVDMVKAYGVDLSTANYIRFGFNNADVTDYASLAIDNFSIDFPVRLSATEISLSEKVVSWTAVENATSYDVHVGTEVTNVNTTSFTISDEGRADGVYEVYVVAKADGCLSSTSNSLNYTCGNYVYPGVADSADITSSLEASIGTITVDTTMKSGSLSQSSLRLNSASGGDRSTSRTKTYNGVAISASTFTGKVLSFDYYLGEGASTDFRVEFGSVTVNLNTTHDYVTTTDLGGGWIHVEIDCDSIASSLTSANRIGFTVKAQSTSAILTAYIDNLILKDKES